jgi:hypothetical protein
MEPDWGELGIAPTSDRQAIRRAYATKLKLLDPTADPAVFRRLRAAYEAALLAASGGEPALQRASPMVRPDIALRIDGLLAQSDLAGAFALVRDANMGELSLASTNEIEQRLLQLAAGIPRLPPGVLPEIARYFGWQEATHPLRAANPALFAHLDRRLDAESWYADLCARAASGGFLSNDAFAARLILRGPPRWHETAGLADWRMLLGTPRFALTQALQQFDRHEHWIFHLFDARRLRWCRWRTRPQLFLFIYIMGFGSIVPIIGFVQTRELLPSLAVLSVSALGWAIAALVVFAATRPRRR